MKYLTATILSICTLFGSTLAVHAQSTVSGTVTESETGNTLPGVNILVKNTTVGTTTDSGGNYSLTVPSPKDTLVFSYIGYATQEIAVNGRSTINVNLTPKITIGEDLIVIGYGTQQEQDNTGS